MHISAALFVLTFNAIAAFAHGNDILSPRQLHALARRQDDITKCTASLQARHEARMADLHVKRSAILAARQGPGPGPGPDQGGPKGHGPGPHSFGPKPKHSSTRKAGKSTAKTTAKTKTTTTKTSSKSSATLSKSSTTSSKSTTSSTTTTTTSTTTTTTTTTTTAAVSSSTAVVTSAMPSMSGNMTGMPTGTPPGGFSGTDMGGGAAGGGETTYTATATAVASHLTAFPSTTAGAAPASQTTQASDGACALSPEEEEGPYYIPGELVRSDLIEDQPGIPLYAQISLIDTTSCAALVAASVDIWSCNATGSYAGFTDTGDSSQYNGEIAHVGDKNDVGSTITDAETFLRGQQLTDSDGSAYFTTLMPGWYAGRAAHIHIRVHVGGELTTNGTYIGGNLTHTGQSFFGEDLYSQIENVFPYSGDTNLRTTNDEDRPWTQQNGTYSAWNLYYVVEGDVTQGLIGYLNLGVDSTASGENGL